MIPLARSVAFAAAIFFALAPPSGVMAQGNSENYRNDQNGGGAGNNGQGNVPGHDQQSNPGGGGGGGGGYHDEGGDAGEPQEAGGPGPGSTTQGYQIIAPGIGVLPPALDSDAERALDAVRNHSALPLADIVATATEDHPGKLIDARLIAVENFLLYELKLLEPDGDVTTVYYYARSGVEVRVD